jgi:hypothetical protein
MATNKNVRHVVRLQPSCSHHTKAAALGIQSSHGAALEEKQSNNTTASTLNR